MRGKPIPNALQDLEPPVGWLTLGVPSGPVRLGCPRVFSSPEAAAEDLWRRQHPSNPLSRKAMISSRQARGTAVDMKCPANGGEPTRNELGYLYHAISRVKEDVRAEAEANILGIVATRLLATLLFRLSFTMLQFLTIQQSFQPRGARAASGGAPTTTMHLNETV